MVPFAAKVVLQPPGHGLHQVPQVLAVIQFQHSIPGNVMLQFPLVGGLGLPELHLIQNQAFSMGLRFRLLPGQSISWMWGFSLNQEKMFLDLWHRVSSCRKRVFPSCVVNNSSSCPGPAVPHPVHHIPILRSLQDSPLLPDKASPGHQPA
jgi:hypothetical protein